MLRRRTTQVRERAVGWPVPDWLPSFLPQPRQPTRNRFSRAGRAHNYGRSIGAFPHPHGASLRHVPRLTVASLPIRHSTPHFFLFMWTRQTKRFCRLFFGYPQNVVDSAPGDNAAINSEPSLLLPLLIIRCIQPWYSGKSRRTTRNAGWRDENATRSLLRGNRSQCSRRFSAIGWGIP